MNREKFLKLLPSLAQNYKPSPEVLSKIGNLSLVMVIGPSGVGKTSVIERLNLKYVPSDTTRAARPGEKEGVDFYFLNNYQKIISDLKNGQFVQVAVDSGGDLKATRSSSYPDSGTIVMAIVTDVVPIMRSLGFRQSISTFVTPPIYEEWMRRLKSHRLTKEQLSKRLAEAKRSLEFALTDEQMHFILADEVELAVKQVEDLVKGKTDAEREKTARKAAEEMLKGIN
jgi:guanylate kinase